MIRQDLRDKMSELGYEDSLVYDCPSFDNSIIGIDDEGRTVYDYDKMVEELAFSKDFLEGRDIDDLTEEEKDDLITQAIEFIDYNTIRATPYMGASAPVIIDEQPDWTTEEMQTVNLINGELYDTEKIIEKV